MLDRLMKIQTVPAICLGVGLSLISAQPALAADQESMTDIVKALANTLGPDGMPRKPVSPLFQNLLSCYTELKPYSDTGTHATIYSETANYVVLPGDYSNHRGVYVYSDQGAAFVAIDPSYSRKSIAFAVHSNRGPASVIYQPADSNTHAQAWMRGASRSANPGVTPLFSQADDSQRRAPLETELNQMIQGVSGTLNQREEKMVHAAESGKGLWLEVDPDHYRKALSTCLGSLPDAPELSSLKTSINNALSSLKDHSGSQKPEDKGDDTAVYQM